MSSFNVGYLEQAWNRLAELEALGGLAAGLEDSRVNYGTVTRRPRPVWGLTFPAKLQAFPSFVNDLRITAKCLGMIWYGEIIRQESKAWSRTCTCSCDRRQPEAPQFSSVRLRLLDLARMATDVTPGGARQFSATWAGWSVGELHRNDGFPGNMEAAPSRCRRDGLKSL